MYIYKYFYRKFEYIGYVLLPILLYKFVILVFFSHLYYCLIMPFVSVALIVCFLCIYTLYVLSFNQMLHLTNLSYDRFDLSKKAGN